MKPGLVLISAAIGVLACQSGRAEDPTAHDEVRALLVGKCLTCHASESKKGGLDLTRRASALAGGDTGAAIVPGKPADSLLIERLAEGEMPPKEPLTANQIAAFRKWVEAGAPYAAEPLAPRRAGPDWWSLRPIQRPKVPDAASDRVRNPIDAFIAEKRRAHRLEAAPEADRVTLVRRASFDLIGLPPTPDEVDAFVNDPSTDAYERLIDRLLASPRYGERWGRHWLDVVRFGESQGYEMNHLRPTAWPYRDYVIRAFNRDTPLPRFALEQLAGDTLTDGDWLSQAATGFLVGGAHDEVGNATVEGQLQQRMDDLDDIITATSSAFLGLTVNCARCHDHKFDPITQKDYYRLQAVFAGVRHGERAVPVAEPGLARREAAAVEAELARIDRRLDEFEAEARRPVNARRNVERFSPVAARSLRFTVLATNDQTEPCIDEIEAWTAEDLPRNVALASAGGVPSASSEYPDAAIHKVAHLNDGLYGNGRSWISRERGQGVAEVAWPRLETIDRVVWGRDRDEKFPDRLATGYRLEVAVGPGQWQVVASSSDHPTAAPASPPPPDLTARRAELRARLAELRGPRTLYAGTFETPGPTRLLLRGDPMQPGEAVAPAGVATVRPPLALASDAPEPERRAALARWIGHPDNPLPARVLVNRAWHYHFGRGLVATPSDFGFNAGPPSHPELLDWLAGEFLANGGHLKPIHRLIMTSATYRQSSRADARGLAADRDDRWLWRTPPRRLEAEPLRDAILAVAGTLDPRMGGPGYTLWEKNTNYVVVFQPRDALGPDTFRRMIYQFKPRSQADPTFGAFDCPDAALIAPRRTVSTTALQALNLWNSGFLIDQSQRFADRLLREAGTDPKAQADRAFRLAFGRAPGEPERNGAVALIQSHGAPAFCRALYNANEFVYLR